MRREVYSSVSAVGRSMCVSGGSSSDSCGSGESGKVGEERHLLLAHDALALGHVRRRHLDADGLVVLEDLLGFLDLLLAHGGGEPAFLAVAARLDAIADRAIRPLDAGAR